MAASKEKQLHTKPKQTPVATTGRKAKVVPRRKNTGIAKGGAKKSGARKRGRVISTGTNTTS
jgi:hypothetical protein